VKIMIVDGKDIINISKGMVEGHGNLFGFFFLLLFLVIIL
jgi:hypothetical protein